MKSLNSNILFSILLVKKLLVFFWCWENKYHVFIVKWNDICKKVMFRTTTPALKGEIWEKDLSFAVTGCLYLFRYL